MKKIGIIGRIDPKGTLFDGQTVKTRTVWKMLCERYGPNNILAVETMGYRKNPSRIVRELHRCLKECDDVIVMLSHNGRKVFFPYLKRQAKYHGKRIYHDLIGGKLAIDVKREPRLVEQLNSFEVNWVESRTLVNELQQLGITNSEYLPNFKQISPIGSDELDTRILLPRRLCTFSRVTEQKGILEAIEATEILCDRDGGAYWSLDIYGPLDPEFRTTFENALTISPHVNYLGSVGPDNSVAVLKQYWALLFPTKWKGEGFPGTVIDALAAALPIVASRWRYYDEMLQDGATGESYDVNEGAGGLVNAIDLLASREDHMIDIRKSCLARARDYSAETLFNQMIQRIESAR